MPEEQPGIDVDARAFMMLEFESQRDMRASLNNLVATEINIYIAIVGATFLALAFAGQALQRGNGLSDLSRVGIGTAMGALFAVGILGWAIYSRVVSSRITVVRYARTMNRVRRYFVDRYSGLEGFVSSDIHDDSPPFGAVGTSLPVLAPISANTGMIAILNSSIVAALVGIGISTLGDAPNGKASMGGWQVLFVVLVFFLSIAFHHAYQSYRYFQEEGRWVALHPNPGRTQPPRPVSIKLRDALVSRGFPRR